MKETVYLLCALTSLACAVLLWRGFRRSRARLLLWSALCFLLLTINNALLFIDKVVLPDMEIFMGVGFSLWRSVVAVAAMSLLLVGLIWDSQ